MKNSWRQFMLDTRENPEWSKYMSPDANDKISEAEAMVLSRNDLRVVIERVRADRTHLREGWVIEYLNIAVFEAGGQIWAAFSINHSALMSLFDFMHDLGFTVPSTRSNGIPVSVDDLLESLPPGKLRDLLEK